MLSHCKSMYFVSSNTVLLYDTAYQHLDIFIFTLKLSYIPDNTYIVLVQVYN